MGYADIEMSLRRTHAESYAADLRVWLPNYHADLATNVAVQIDRTELLAGV
jgi:hypothetical protein